MTVAPTGTRVPVGDDAATQHELVPEALRRAAAYLDAGADCVYPIALHERSALRRFISQIGGPVNVICLPGTLPAGELAALGAARVSWGPFLYREAMARFEDPAKNFAFEVHQYMDDDFSGTKGNCSRAGDAVDALKAFTNWLKEHGFRGFLGEFGAPVGKVRCIDALKSMVEVTEDNKDVWTGWTYWAAGDWWPASEDLNIQPTAEGDRPQLAGLEPALSDFSASGKNCPSLN